MSSRDHVSPHASTVAVLPILSMPFVVAPGSWLWWAVGLSWAATVALAHADARELTRDGVDVRTVLEILGGVVYLLHRARRTGSKPVLPGIWLASAGVWAVGVVWLAPQDASFDRADVAARVERWAELNFADSVEVRCPELEREAGDSVICTGRSAAGNVVLFEVSVDDDRQLTWKIVG